MGEYTASVEILKPSVTLAARHAAPLTLFCVCVYMCVLGPGRSTVVIHYG